MATFTRYTFSMTITDGTERTSVVSYYVTAAAFQEYVDAADLAARAGTALGILKAKVDLLTLGFISDVSVSLSDLVDPVTIPAATVLRGDKLAFSLRSGGRGIDTSIPARDPAHYVQDSHLLELDLTTPTEMTDWVTAVEANVVDAFGNPVTVAKGKVVD